MDAAEAEVARSSSGSGRQGPKWLDAFVEARYFSQCSKHRFGKSERNFFCTDCSQGPLCGAGVRESHAAHLTLQARKASYKDAVRMSDVQRILDISAIETYVINGAKIVFLHRRPQANPPQGVPSCEVCRRSFRDQVRFCSIQCKLEAVRGNGSKDASFTLHATAELEDTKMDHGMIINPPQGVTNFRVHGEQLIRNLTPPRKLWNFLGLQPMQEPGTPLAAGSQQILPVDDDDEQHQARPWPAPAVAGHGDKEQRLKYPHAIQHKGKRIIPLTGRLLSQFSLNSWLNECKGKRKLDDNSPAPVAQGHEDMHFTFLPPGARPSTPAVLEPPPSVVIPKARRIVDTSPHHPAAILQSPTTSSSRSDLSSEAQASYTCRLDTCCCCFYDCTCLTLNSSHNVAQPVLLAQSTAMAGRGLLTGRQPNEFTHP